jgi:hypothetical protein
MVASQRGWSQKIVYFQQKESSGCDFTQPVLSMLKGRPNPWIEIIGINRWLVFLNN